MIDTNNAVAVAPCTRGRYTADTTLSAGKLDGAQRALTAAELKAVLGRNETLTLTHSVDDGSRRSQRARYAYVDGALLLLASECPQSLRCEPHDHAVECDVSELIGLSVWHYVWLHGTASCAQPTGSAAERGEWRAAVEQLRRAFPELARAEELAFSNFGIIRIEIRAYVGLALSMMSATERSVVAPPVASPRQTGGLVTATS